MRMPADNKIVEAEGRATRDWRNYWQKLEPSTDLSAEDVAALKALLGTDPAADTVSQGFTRLDAYNQENIASGGSLLAANGETISLNIAGAAGVRTAGATNSMSLAVGSFGGVIPGVALAITQPNDGSLANRTLSPNLIYMVPILVPSRRTLTAIGWYQAEDTPNRSGNWSISLYTDYNGGPGHRLASSGTLATGGGSTSVLTSAINVDVDGGTYWLAWTTDMAVALSKCWGGHSSMGVRATDLDPVHGYSRSATFDGMLDNETGSLWTPIYTDVVPALVAL